MSTKLNTKQSLLDELKAVGIEDGDGLFIHASMGAIGTTVGGARAVVEALFQAVGSEGLIGMPAFSTDAYFPANLDDESLSASSRAKIEDAVLGFDAHTSAASGMGVIAETFRTWPQTVRSQHPAVSVCLNGPDADQYLDDHALAWATGEQSPLGKLRLRPRMKIVLIGVGWNRCSALHTAESLCDTPRTKTRRFKNSHGQWQETIDVADDNDRLFPCVGEAFENTGAVETGNIGQAPCKICLYAPLVAFASELIAKCNVASGDRH